MNKKHLVVVLMLTFVLFSLTAAGTVQKEVMLKISEHQIIGDPDDHLAVSLQIEYAGVVGNTFSLAVTRQYIPGEGYMKSNLYYPKSKKKIEIFGNGDWSMIVKIKRLTRENITLKYLKTKGP